MKAKSAWISSRRCNIVPSPLREKDRMRGDFLPGHNPQGPLTPALSPRGEGAITFASNPMV